MTFEFQRWMNNLLIRMSKSPRVDGSQSPAESWHLRMMQEASQLLAGGLTPARLTELSRDGNGFVREGALRALIEYPSVGALQAITERLNDWVPTVRRAAQQAFDTYLEQPHVHLLLRCLDDVVQLETRHRDDHAALLQRVGVVLSQGALRAQACTALLQLRGRASRYLFRVLYAADPDARCELVAQAMSHDALTVRSLALQQLADVLDEGAAPLLTTAFGDPVPALRSRALGMLLSQHGTDGERQQWTERGAVDRSAGVRGLARWYAGKSQIDLSPLRNRLDSQPHRPATETIALLELNEAAGVVNLRLLEASLAHPFATVRIAALGCVVRQAPQLAASALRRALLDPSSKVFRLASDMVRKLNVGVTAEDVLDACMEALAQQEMQRAVAVATLLPLWLQLDALLRCYGKVPSTEGMDALCKWESRQAKAYWIKPATGESVRIRARWAELQSRQLAPGLPRLLFALRQFGLAD